MQGNNGVNFHCMTCLYPSQNIVCQSTLLVLLLRYFTHYDFRIQQFKKTVLRYFSQNASVTNTPCYNNFYIILFRHLSCTSVRVGTDVLVIHLYLDGLYFHQSCLYCWLYKCQCHFVEYRHHIYWSGFESRSMLVQACN